MAEQEACAQIVADAVEESALETGDQQPRDDGECHSGDGEEILPEPLLRDVHGALSRLQGALRTTNGLAPRDSALLELVARLQAGLLVQEPPTSRPRGLVRRRTGKNRHTVGVTKEELADARKFMEGIAFPNKPPTKEPQEEPRASPYALQKQASFGTVLSPTYDRFASINPVKNATARPFNLNTYQQFPEAHTRELSNIRSPQYENYLSSKNIFNPAYPIVNGNVKPRPILKESVSLDTTRDISAEDSAKIIQEALTKPIKNKTPEPEEDSESDSEFSDCSTIKIEEIQNGDDLERTTPLVNSNHQIDTFSPNAQLYKNYATQKMPENKIATQKGQENYNVKQYESQNYNLKQFETQKMQEAPINKSNEEQKFQNRQNKKLRMKRANTIDIPKPLHCYQVESDDESDSNSSMKNADSILNPEFKPKLPEFKPKTENDLKFLAFIQKHDGVESSSPWAHNANEQRNQGCNWKSCFGSIKNVFENTNDRSESQKNLDANRRASSVSSARNFWKASDDATNYAKPSKFTPKITKSSFNQLNEMHDRKKYQSKLPWAADTKDEVLTGSITIAPPKTAVPDKVIKLIPKPAPVNQFYHAPMSAFKPLPKKSISAPMNPPAKIWSPPSYVNNTIKEDRANFILNKPPVQKIGAPWAQSNSPKENRVLSLATNKFEKISPTPISPQSPNIPPYREKQFNPIGLQNGQDVKALAAKRLSLPQALPAPGPLSAPHLVRQLENLKQQLSNNEKEEKSLPKIDAERLQIEFYEKQIREHSKNLPKPTIEESAELTDKYVYTVTDYTPPVPISTFVPLPNEDAPEDCIVPIPKTESVPPLTKAFVPIPQVQNIIDTKPQLLNTSIEDYKSNIYIPENKNFKTLYDDLENVEEKPKIDYEESKLQQLKTFKSVPQKPDIEDTKLQPSKKLPDVVLNDKEQYISRKSPIVLYNNTKIDDDEYNYIQNQGKFLDSPKAINDPYKYDHVQNAINNQINSEVPLLPKTNDLYKYEQIPNGNGSLMNKIDYNQVLNLPKKSAPVLNEKEKIINDPYKYEQLSNGNCAKINNQVPNLPKKSAPVMNEKDNIYKYDQLTNGSKINKVDYNNLPKKSAPVMNGNVSKINKIDYNKKSAPVVENGYHSNSKGMENEGDLVQKEYKAVAKVMRGPVSQQASIKAQPSQDNYEKRDSAAKSLKGVLQKFSSPKLDVIKQMEKRKSESQEVKKPVIPEPVMESQNGIMRNQDQVSVPIIKYNNIVSPRALNDMPYPEFNRDHSRVSIPHHRFKDKTAKEAIEIAENGESIVSSKLQFSPLNKMYMRSPVNSPASTPSPTGLSRSESWHQLAQLHAMKPPSPRISPGAKLTSRAKSMHLLALPKQFEAGITKDKVEEKKKTVEAYFSGQSSPHQLSKSSSQQGMLDNLMQMQTSPKPSTQVVSRVNAVDKHKRNEKVAQVQSFALGRSQTMPQMTYAELALLDEDNVDDAFDDLYNACT